MASVIIVGGGLVGCVAALFLRREGWAVTVVEKRTDLRTLTAESGRSINLIITSRGLHALRDLGIVDAAIALCVPVRGRMMHGVDKSTAYQPYGISLFEVNYSVSRTKLNAMLIDYAEKAGVKFHFEHEIADLDYRAEPVTVTATGPGGSRVTVAADFVLGADGVGSPTRRFLLNALREDGVTAYDAIDRLGIGYREVTFPTDPNNQYSMRADALHIWPRGAHFLMALADKSPTFTGTLYLPDFTAEIKGVPMAPGAANRPPSFEELGANRAKIAAFIEKFYPDVPALVPDVIDQLLDPKRPHSFLATLRLTHWHYGGKIALIGDAAHGIVPFFGQGMNLGLESVVYFVTHLKREGATPQLAAVQRQQRLAAAFAAFQADHQPSATAIANMAVENFTEMSFKVSLPAFLKTKKIENELESRFPTRFRSRYYMVTKTLIPYRVVYRIGVLIDRCVAAVERLLDEKRVASVEDYVKLVGAQSADATLTGLIDRWVSGFLKALDVSVDQPQRSYYDRLPTAWTPAALRTRAAKL